MADLTAFVLAGGHSSRMGCDKAMLSFGDECLLEMAVRKVGAVSDLVLIVGDRASYELFGTTIEDQFKGCGPMGGIHSALCATESELNLILSVDLPLMTSDFLAWVVSEAAKGSELVTVPRISGRLQPLCAVYRKAALPAVERALHAGEYKVDRMFAAGSTRFVEESEIVAAGFSAALFENVNTPAEFDAVRQSARVAGSKS